MPVKIEHPVIRQLRFVCSDRPGRHLVSIKGGHHRFGKPGDLLIGKIFHVLGNQPIAQGAFRTVYHGVGMFAFIRRVVRIDLRLGRVVRIRQIQADKDQREQRQ
ncbi:Uncharacterised protein [Klebsiella pneumoniae]|nr:Uncharacterised protein [Klebsiella pneumoniae]